MGYLAVGATGFIKRKAGDVLAQRATWPLRAGLMPPLADCYVPRPETGHGLASNLMPGDVVVLTAGDRAGSRTETPGGTGETQLAVGLAHALWETRAVDLLVWVTANSRDAVVTGYAQALDEVSGGPSGDDPVAAAERFADWLSGTGRPWLLVLDDVTDPADLDGLWPDSDAGRVLVTSRRNDPALHQDNRRVVDVGPLTRREALSYLSAKFNNDPSQRIGALDLAEDLGCLPIALAQAAAVIADGGTSCSDYRLAFSSRSRHVAPAAADHCSAIVAVTWSLCIDRADQLPPAGMAWPALVLTALLDPEGIPGPVLMSPAACRLVAGDRATGTTSDRDQVRAAVANLARLGLVTIDPFSPARTVRVHRLVQAAVKTYLAAEELEHAAWAAAETLLQAWPDGDGDPLLAQALRDCTARLRGLAGDSLWKPEGHPVLFRAGESLDNAGLTDSAVAYWQEMADTRSRVHGEAHAQPFRSEGGLTQAQEQADRIEDAIAAYERTLAEREWTLGPDHPGSIASRSDLAAAYRDAGRLDEAIALYERTLSDREQIAGTDHPDTLASRAELAASYRIAGRHDDAITVYRRTLEDRERIQGPDHLDTLTARGNLAYAYQSARRIADAIPLYERTLADYESIFGPDHPDTLTSRANLGQAYYAAGWMTDAIRVFGRTLADCERVLGLEHPLTQTVRENLDAATRA